MEANSTGMNNGNGRDLSSESDWIEMNLPYFIKELCKLANISVTDHDILSQSVNAEILQTFRQRQKELIRLKGFMKSLCAITGVSTAGEDLCSQSFVNSLVEYVRQDRVLMEAIREHFAERQLFRSGTGRVENPEIQPPSLVACHSSDDSVSSETSEMARNKINEVAEVDIPPVNVE